MNTQTLFRVVVIAQSVLPDPGYTQVWSAYNRVWHLVSVQWGFLGTSAGKESACNAGDPSSIPGLGRSPGEGIGYPPPQVLLGFPGCSDSNESTYNAGDLGLIPGLGRSPGGGHSNPLQYSCLENPHGQRSVAGYSPWDGRESDTTEQLSAQHKCSVTTSYCYMSGTTLGTS